MELRSKVLLKGGYEMNEIKTLLNDEIQSEIEDLSQITLGSEEYKVTVDGLAKLMDRAIEMDKIEADRKERKEKLKIDLDKMDQDLENELMNRREERKSRMVKDTITVAGILIPTIVTIWGTKVTLDFEKEGTVTTIMGRGFINKLLPNKK